MSLQYIEDIFVSFCALTTPHVAHNADSLKRDAFCTSVRPRDSWTALLLLDRDSTQGSQEEIVLKLYCIYPLLYHNFCVIKMSS